VEVVSEKAVLRIIDDWWRHAPVSPTPLMAAQITLRLGPQLPRGADAAVVVTQVVGLIRGLARRGCVRALPDGSAVLSYLVAPSRLAAPTPWPAPLVGVRSTPRTTTRSTVGPVPVATPAATQVVPATGGTPAAVSSFHGVNTLLASTWGTVTPSALAIAERWAPRLQPDGLGAGASSGARPARRINDVGPHGTFRVGRSERIVIRLMLVLFLMMTIGVVVVLDRLIDIPIRNHGVLYCGDSGQPSSKLPRCSDSGGR
jgi:hypothetical protein